MGIEKITYPVEDDFFKLEVWNNNIKAIAEQFRTDENRLTAVEKKAGTNTTNIGTLSNLTTTEKGSIVGAINEHNDELNILNASDIQCFFQNANTFAVSTSTEDIVNCGGRGGTLTAENHRILILNAHYGINCHGYLMIAKTAEELSYSELGSGHDVQIIKKHITKTGKTIYVALLKDTWVDNKQFSPYARAMSVTINGVNKNMMNYVEVPNLFYNGSGKLTPCLYDLADFILFSWSYLWVSDDKIAGFYPSSDQYRSNIGSLSSLTTKDKSSLVGAVNEVRNKVVKISSGNSTSISTLSQSGYMTKGTIKYVEINGFCTVFFDKFYCFSTSGGLSDATLVNSSLPRPVTGFKINDEITVSSSGKLIGGDDAGGSITFTGTVTYPLYSAL